MNRDELTRQLMAMQSPALPRDLTSSVMAGIVRREERMASTRAGRGTHGRWGIFATLVGGAMAAVALATDAQASVLQPLAGMPAIALAIGLVLYLLGVFNAVKEP